MSSVEIEISLMESTLASLEVMRSGLYASESAASMNGPMFGGRLQRMTPLNEIMHNHNYNLVSGNLSSVPKPIDTEINFSPNGSPNSSPAPPLFTSSPIKPNNNHSRYKTEICRSFKEQGTCKYGDKCQFAHGPDELRTNNRHPKYKTERCRTFHSNGYCPYGPRCHFIHGEDDEKLSEIRANRGSRHPSGQSITQYPSSPSTPKPPMMSESATGLSFPDTTPLNINSSNNNNNNTIPRGSVPFQGIDESSSDSLMSFVDMDLPSDPPTLQLPSPIVALAVTNRNNNCLPPVSIGPVPLAPGNSNQTVPTKLSNHLNSMRPSQSVQALVQRLSPTLNRYQNGINGIRLLQ